MEKRKLRERDQYRVSDGTLRCIYKYINIYEQKALLGLFTAENTGSSTWGWIQSAMKYILKYEEFPLTYDEIRWTYMKYIEI